jgi:sec-independent protein translocase protein TatA
MLLFLNLGAGEIMVIALVVLFFFGSKQIPDLMKGLGRATREFKDAMNGIEREVRNASSVENERPKNEISDKLPETEKNSTEQG